MKPLKQTLTNKHQTHNKRKHKKSLRRPLHKTFKRTLKPLTTN